MKCIVNYFSYDTLLMINNIKYNDESHFFTYSISRTLNQLGKSK